MPDGDSGKKAIIDVDRSMCRNHLGHPISGAIRSSRGPCRRLCPYTRKRLPRERLRSNGLLGIRSCLVTWRLPTTEGDLGERHLRVTLPEAPELPEMPVVEILRPCVSGSVFADGAELSAISAFSSSMRSEIRSRSIPRSQSRTFPLRSRICGSCLMLRAPSN